MIQTPSPIKKTPMQGARPPKFNFWSSLGTTVSVAILVATLFTIWTPASLFSNRLSDSLSRALNSKKPVNRNLPEPTPRPSMHIGLVAGHFGDEGSGAVCPDGLKESDVNLNIATLVQQKLLEQGYTVDLLGEFDNKLKQYSGLALVSIHNDTCDYIDDTSSGFKVAPSLFSSSRPEKTDRLTSCLIDRYQASTNLQFINIVTDDMTKYHMFEEVNSNTPSVVMETGYLNLDREILTKQTALVAQGITDGILCYLKNQPIISTATPQATP